MLPHQIPPYAPASRPDRIVRSYHWKGCSVYVARDRVTNSVVDVFMSTDAGQHEPTLRSCKRGLRFVFSDGHRVTL